MALAPSQSEYHVNGLWKAIDINCWMALNLRDFLAGVVIFAFSSSGVFDAQSVKDKAECPW
jgi:hypothetical protein